jgi:hypothetical protein
MENTVHGNEMERKNTMTCTNNQCEYKPTLKRDITTQRTPDEIRYGQLWAEIELPKLLKEQKQ